MKYLVYVQLIILFLGLIPHWYRLVKEINHDINHFLRSRQNRRRRPPMTLVEVKHLASGRPLSDLSPTCARCLYFAYILFSVIAGPHDASILGFAGWFEGNVVDKGEDDGDG